MGIGGERFVLENPVTILKCKPFSPQKKQYRDNSQGFCSSLAVTAHEKTEQFFSPFRFSRIHVRTLRASLGFSGD